MRLLRIFLIILVSIPATLSATVHVTARFKPPRIALGDTAQYIVEVSETDSKSQPQVERIASLPLPQSNRLKLSNGRTSTSRQTRILNGSAEYSVTQSLVIDAAAPETGSFTIPAYAFEYKDQRLQVPAATLEVVERATDAAPPRDELVFLQADLPEKLYVGQILSFELKLFIAEDVSLSGLNAFDRSGDGFTISELPDDYREGVERAKGRRYRTLTWPLTLTPIQTGEQELSFHFGLTARLPDQENDPAPSGRSPFGGSLFDNFFGRSERLNVYTDALTVDVLPLPEEGKPESFSGAIGDFAIEVGADAEQPVEGEPVMLSLVIKGRGNFERINGPDFPEGRDWRHYDPESKFTPGDSLGLSGSLRFDYVFIPQRAGELELPETEFSYFDPKQEEYVELTAPPIPVEVAAAENNLTATTPPPATKAPESSGQLAKSLTSEEALLTLDYRPKDPRPVGLGILRNPAFISLNIVAGLAVIGGALFLRRRKRHGEDPRYPVRMAAKSSLRESRAACLQARQNDDAEAFYQHGQSAIRHAATLKTGRPMQSAESAQIESLLSGQVAGDCRGFFEAANALRFGGNTREPLSEAQQQLERILKAL